MPIRKVTDPGKWGMTCGILIPSHFVPIYLGLSLVMAWTWISLPRGLPYLQGHSIGRCPRGHWLPCREPGPCWGWQSPCWPETEPKPGRGAAGSSRGGRHWAPSPGVGRLGREDTANISTSELGSSSWSPSLLTMQPLTMGIAGRQQGLGFQKAWDFPRWSHSPQICHLSVEWQFSSLFLGADAKSKYAPVGNLSCMDHKALGFGCEMMHISPEWCVSLAKEAGKSQSKKADHRAFIWVRLLPHSLQEV